MRRDPIDRTFAHWCETGAFMQSSADVPNTAVTQTSSYRMHPSVRLAVSKYPILTIIHVPGTNKYVNTTRKHTFNSAVKNE